MSFPGDRVFQQGINALSATPRTRSRKGKTLQVTSVRRDWMSALVCLLAGLVLCALPHAAGLKISGSAVWVADQDELYYLGTASQAFHEHLLRLGDPARDGGHSLYQALPLLPGVWIARFLGMGPAMISLVWRCWGGALAGLAWYWVVRGYRVRPAVALGIALLLLIDIGMLEFRPFLRLGWVAGRVFSGHPGSLFASKPMIFRQFRIATPCLTMPFLLLFIGLHQRARLSGSTGSQIVSGLGFGLLFYVYFYYWTAAAVALVITAVLDSGHRRVTINTAWIGILAGTPSFIASVHTRATTPPDWLWRTDKFVTIARSSGLTLPIPALALLGLFAVIIWRYHREMILLWSLTASGLLLMNHQIFSKLQIENFHWVYVAGPCLSLLIGLQLARWTAALKSPAITAAMVMALGVCLATAGALRWIEAVKTVEPIAIQTVYRHYQDQRLGPTSPGRLARGAVAAADELVGDWSAILEGVRPLSNYWIWLSPSVVDDEWDRRIALNAYLMGQERAAFERDQQSSLRAPGFQGPWGRDPAQFARRLESRLTWFERIAAEPDDALKKAGVRYVRRKLGDTPPGDQARWAQFQNGPFWSVWEYRAAD